MIAHINTIYPNIKLIESYDLCDYISAPSLHPFFLRDNIIYLSKIIKHYLIVS